MYSIFLPFAAVVVDLCVAYIYFKVTTHPKLSDPQKNTNIISSIFPIWNIDLYKVNGSVIFCQSNYKTVSITTTIVGFGCLMIMIMIMIIVIMIMIIVIIIIIMIMIMIISTIGGLEEGRLP